MQILFLANTEKVFTVVRILQNYYIQENTNPLNFLHQYWPKCT